MRLPKEVTEYLRAHHGVITWAICLQAGMSRDEILGRVARGEWVRMHRGVYGVAGLPPTPEAVLMAACAAAGPRALASHRSAAWLWGLRPSAPALPEVSVGPGRDSRPQLCRVHRMKDLGLSQARERFGVPCTDPLRTVLDVAAVAERTELDDLIDQALAVRLIDVDGLEAELARLAKRGRAGVGRMRQTLGRRGLIGAPHPSVLESRLLRVLGQAGIVPAGTEVVMRTEEGRGYRLDAQIVPGLAVEVDGYRYHHSPEHKTADERRRNRIRLQGTFLLVYTWWDVVNDPARIIREIRTALDRAAISPTA